MKKTIFWTLISFCMLLFAQNNMQVTNYTDSMYIEVDSTVMDSLINADSLAMKDTISQYSIGLDTTYLKSIQRVDTQKVAFTDGVKFFNSKKYYDALQIFQDMKEIPENQNAYLSTVDMMITKTYLRLGNYEKAIYSGYEFESCHKNSTYLDDVQFTIGEAYMSQGRYNDALLYYMNVLKNTTDSRLIEKCHESMDILTDIFLTIDDLHSLKNSMSVKFYSFLLSLKIIEKNHYNGDDDNIEQELNRLKREAKTQFLYSEYQRTLKKIKSSKGGQNYIGVILPLTGDDNMARYSQKILQGIRVAVLRYNQRTDKKISAIVMDNKGDLVTSVLHAKYLTRNPRVIAIIGPVKSENVIAAGTYANENEIPLISPTAEFNNITKLGPWLFQANINIRNTGNYLAKYCTAITKNPNVATLAPLNTKSEQLTDSFSETVDINGGRIISQQWYGNAEQLSVQFMSIRRAGIRLADEKLEFKVEMMRDSLRALSMQPGSRWNSDDRFLNVTDSVCQLFENGTIKEMSIHHTLRYTGMMSRNDFKIPKVDSLYQRVNSIDGLFLPTDNDDLALIFPNIKYYNFGGNIYGTKNFINSYILRKNPDIARRFYFISDYYIDENSTRYKQVYNDYVKITGAKPGRFGVYGYDTMEVLLMAYYNSNVTREDVKKQLMTMPVYHGVGRNISFNGNQPGSNSCAYILSYRRGTAVPVARIEDGTIIRVR